MNKLGLEARPLAEINRPLEKWHQAKRNVPDKGGKREEPAPNKLGTRTLLKRGN